MNTSIPTTRAAQIHDALDTIQSQFGVTVLFAVESGSRAWGFESVDSDWDVRHVYINPLSHYLRVHPARDVIENAQVAHPDPLLDFSGWDLQKFLQLATKSNPAVFEWLQSTIVYREDWCFGGLRPLLAPFFSPRAAAHHYLSTAYHNFREHMRGGRASVVRQKKFLYITRPLLCLRWIEANPHAGPPPMPFDDVVTAPGVPTEVTSLLRELVVRKRAGEELDEGPAIPALVSFIDTEMARWDADKRARVNALPQGTGDVGVLDRWFLDNVTRSSR